MIFFKSKIVIAIISTVYVIEILVDYDSDEVGVIVSLDQSGGLGR